MLASETNKHWHKGYVSGSFDMFHIGHLNLIRRAKERCDHLIVGVLTDELIFERKQKWPVIPLSQRMEIVSSIRYVDEVIVTTPDIIPRVMAWEMLRFDAFFTGDDWKDVSGQLETERNLNERGADLVFFPYTKEQTTTIIQETTLPPPAENADRARRIDSFSYIFPFDKVKKGERIVIYGVGAVGQQYLKQLEALNFCQITAAIDSKAHGRLISFRDGHLSVWSPNQLAKESSYDRIVIASAKAHDEIVKRLRALRIPAEKIV